jgi:MraZ protein
LWVKVEQRGALRGNYTARIDDKGRLKIPNAYRSVIEALHGTELFVTSLTGDSVSEYPMPVWMALEERLAKVPTSLPARQKYLDRVNYYGQVAEIDGQGRVVIHPRLRESAAMSGEVDVFGRYDFLEVCNHERFVTTRLGDPYTLEDANALAQYDI